MSRIRSIKPKFFKHEELFDAERATGLPLRLAFAGLWTVADREGRFKWKPREIKTDVLPYDDVDFSAVMDALAKYNFILKYRCGGDVLGYIPKFAEHQHVNPREAPSIIASPADADLDADASRTRKPRVKHATPTRLREELTAGTSGSLDHREQEGEGKEKTRARALVTPEPLPDWIPLKAWEAFVEMRLSIRAPLSNNAIALLIGKLGKLRIAGHEPGAVLEQSVMNSWKGLFEVKHEQRRTQQQGRGIRDAAERALAAVRRDAGEDGAGTGTRDAEPSRAPLAIGATPTTGAAGDTGTDHPGNGGAGRGFPKPKAFSGGTDVEIPRVLRGPGAPIGAAIADGVQALSLESGERFLSDAGQIVSLGAKVILQ